MVLSSAPLQRSIVESSTRLFLTNSSTASSSLRRLEFSALPSIASKPKAAMELCSAALRFRCSSAPKLLRCQRWTRHASSHARLCKRQLAWKQKSRSPDPISTQNKKAGASRPSQLQRAYEKAAPNPDVISLYTKYVPKIAAKAVPRLILLFSDTPTAI